MTTNVMNNTPNKMSLIIRRKTNEQNRRGGRPASADTNSQEIGEPIIAYDIVHGVSRLVFIGSLHGRTLRSGTEPLPSLLQLVQATLCSCPKTSMLGAQRRLVTPPRPSRGMRPVASAARRSIRRVELGRHVKQPGQQPCRQLHCRRTAMALEIAREDPTSCPAIGTVILVVPQAAATTLWVSAAPVTK